MFLFVALVVNLGVVQKLSGLKSLAGHFSKRRDTTLFRSKKLSDEVKNPDSRLIAMSRDFFI